MQKTSVKRQISAEEQRENEVQRRLLKQTKKRSSKKRSELQRIRERRGGKSRLIWVFSPAKAQKNSNIF